VRRVGMAAIIVAMLVAAWAGIKLIVLI